MSDETPATPNSRLMRGTERRSFESIPRNALRDLQVAVRWNLGRVDLLLQSGRAGATDHKEHIHQPEPEPDRCDGKKPDCEEDQARSQE